MTQELGYRDPHDRSIQLDLHASTGPRDRILTYLEQCDGESISEIADRIGVAWNTAAYHVRRLTHSGDVRVVRCLGRTRVFVQGPAAAQGSIQSGLVMDLHHHGVLRVLASQRDATPAELRRRLRLGRKAVKTRLRDLVRAGLLDHDGRYHPRYWPTPKGRAIIRDAHE